MLFTPGSRNNRLEMVLVLARLALKHTPCQQDMIREGIAPLLVEMMEGRVPEVRGLGSEGRG